MDKHEVLKHYYGYDSFRPGQERIIDAILSGKDAFGIMPTGGGKSICYQIPALLLSGVTFVVSPLISLMQDQVMQLKESGVPAAFINSTLSLVQLYAVYRNLYSGMYKIIYVAPERLETEEFRNAVANLEISLFAVDEAHCISQWGQDFRPSYLKIPEFLSKLKKRPVVSAFTATATEKVRHDIETILELDKPEKVITSFDRPNLFFDVLKPKNKNKALLSLISDRKGKSGIVYCSTRSKVETVCEKLCSYGISATRYHAGLDDEERQQNQEDFLFDKKPVMVATNAFGMGINKSNVGYVIHYNMPKSLEEYYQEAGRAGRDGEKADCVLMYGASDVITAKFLVANGAELSDKELWEQYPKGMERLEAMIGYCEGTGCYRAKVLGYFGETHDDFCGNCGNCIGEYENMDITVEAQKILSCIERIYRKKGYYLGKAMVIGTLRGRKSGKLLDNGLDTLSVYGIMRDDSHDYVEKIFDYLCASGFIVINDEYKTARTSLTSQTILKGEEKVYMPFKKQSQAEKIEKDDRKRKKKVLLEDTADNSDLFEVLRKLRLEIAAKEKQPPFVIFHDSTLRDMATKKPMDKRQFLEVSGIGEKKAEKYGDAFLRVIREFEFCDTGNTAEKTTEDIEEKPQSGILHEILSVTVDGESEKQDELKASVKNVPNTQAESFEPLIREAKIVLSEHPCVNSDGVPAKATVILTSCGTLYSAVNTGKGSGLSASETKMLYQMTKEYDTRALKILSMWHDGSVFGTSPMIFKRLFELERKNRDADILVSKSTKVRYEGVFNPDDYKITKLKDYL